MKLKPNLMIFHAGTGTYFGLGDDDVYVIDPDKMTDEMNDELDDTGEMPAEAIDSEACVSWEEFMKNMNDLTWSNCIAYSPTSIREELEETLSDTYSGEEWLAWAENASDDELNEVARYILSADDVWQNFTINLVEGLREGYRWSQQKCDHEYDSYCGKCGLSAEVE